jgi:hypothetical protein
LFGGLWVGWWVGRRGGRKEGDNVFVCCRNVVHSLFYLEFFFLMMSCLSAQALFGALRLYR